VELFRVKGVPVRVGWSWLVVLLLIYWSLAGALFPADYPALSRVTHLVMAGVATVLVFVSILVHELSHTLRSLREGVPVRDITLWLFGGVSRADEPLPGPGAEFRVVVAGPIASAVLAVGFAGIALAARAAGLPEAFVGVPEYLARINALLLAFNLVPALPLDGGRLLHAFLWWRSGDSVSATVDAAAAGRALGAVLVAIGLVSFLVGGDLGGLWFVFLGWFLLQAVRQEVLAARVTRAFADLRVKDLMSTRLVTVDPALTIQEFADDLARWPSHAAYPVLEHDELRGMLLLARAGTVPAERRGSVVVRDVMLPAQQVPVLRPDDLVSDVVRRLTEEPGRAVVMGGPDGAELVGLLSSTDLSRALEAAPLRTGGRQPSRAGAVVGAVVAAAVVLVAAVLYHPPYVVVAPGRAIDVRGDITIAGVPQQRPTGPFLLAPVELTRPNVLVLLADAFRTDREVVPMAGVLPYGFGPEELEDLQRRLFRDSRETAAVAAARAAGYDASLRGDGAEVLGLVPGSPAAEVLETGDTVTGVDGSPVSTLDDLQAALARHPVGDTVSLQVERDGRTLARDVTNAGLPQVTGGTSIGALAATKDLEAVLPFTIRFRERPGLGGPSAGLAYALAITDALDRGDDARGRSVAATGTIAADGSVGPVGAVPEKALVASEAGADVLLVPAGELPPADHRRVRLHGVDDLAQALDVLARAR
jgi:PDZ domain-containing secreted protein/Zn-dependent protease